MLILVLSTSTHALLLAMFLLGFSSPAMAQNTLAQQRIHEAFTLTEHRVRSTPISLAPEARKRWLDFALIALEQSPSTPHEDFHIWWTLLPFAHDPMVAEALLLLEDRLRQHHPDHLPLLLHDAALCHRSGSDATLLRWRAVVLADPTLRLPYARIELARELLLHTTPERLVEAQIHLNTVAHLPTAQRLLDALRPHLTQVSPEVEPRILAQLETGRYDIIGCWRELETPHVLTPATAYRPWDEAEERAPNPSTTSNVRERSASPYRAFDASTETTGSNTRYQAWDEGGSMVAATPRPDPSPTRYRPFDGEPSPYETFGENTVSRALRTLPPSASWRLEGGRPIGLLLELGSKARVLVNAQGWWSARTRYLEGARLLELERPSTRERLLVTELVGTPAQASELLARVEDALCQDASCESTLVPRDDRVLLLLLLNSEASLAQRLPRLIEGP